MGYVRTAGMSTAARRRRRRTALVLTLLLVLLLAAFGYAAAYYQGWLPAPTGGERTQETATGTATATPTEEPPDPAEVTVNVYNAKGTPGLARRTADALRARGFTIGEVANAPEDDEVEESAVIRYGPEGREAARLLRGTVPEATLSRNDDREGPVIDLVLGDAFEDLPAGDETPSTGDDG